MISVLLSACSVYILFLAVHWIPFRVAEVKARTKTMSLTLLACLCLSPFIYNGIADKIGERLESAPYVGALFYSVVFFLLWCGYVQFVFSFDTSPSLRVLVVLLSNMRVTKDKITEIMDFPGTFARRFNRSVQGGAIIETNDGAGAPSYSLTDSSTRLARVGKAAKLFFRLGAGG